MSANNKILIFFIAIAAFVIGIAINSARVDDSSTINTASLLSAQLVDENGADVSVHSKLGRLTLVNFWASWCAPCREEMPIFEAMYRQAKAEGFQVVGIAIDNPDSTRAMLDSMDISYPVLYAEQTGMKIMETAGNPQGLLPYSLLLDKDGRIITHVLGRINEQQISDWLATHLN